jgi:hypothetical protein
MSTEPIRIAGRYGVLNRSADSWEIKIPPREAFRRGVSLMDAFQTSALLFDAWMAFSLVQRWPTFCFESLVMKASDLTVTRYLGGIRKVRSFLWERLRGPALYGPSVYAPQQIRFEDCASGKHSHIALGATQADVDTIKSLIEKFRESLVQRESACARATK